MNVYSVKILNADKTLPSFKTKKDLYRFVSISGVIKDAESHHEYEYSNGYYTLHFAQIQKLLEFLCLEDL